MGKKTEKISQRISKRFCYFSGEKGHDARKDYYGWESHSSNESRSVIIEKSSKEQLMKIIEEAEKAGYTIDDFRITLLKVLDKKTRKEVTFDVDVVR